MKKFTKIILMIAAITVAAGIICSGIAAAMGAGWATIHRKALAGEFDFGNWHFGDGIYYSHSDFEREHGYSIGVDDTEDDDDWDDDDWDDDDWDDDEEDIADNEAVESIGDWVLKIKDQTEEPAGTESQTQSYQAADVQQLVLKLDVIDSLSVEESEDASVISVEMKNGYEKYFSTEQNGTMLKVSYDCNRHNYKKGPEITVKVPKDCEALDMKLLVGVGDIRIKAATAQAGQLLASVGVGNIFAGGVSVANKTELESGMGNVVMEDITGARISAESGMGDASFSGYASEKIELESGMGDVDANLFGAEHEFQLELSSGIGDVKVNGEKVGSVGTDYENDVKDGVKVELTAGMGTVTVQTR